MPKTFFITGVSSGLGRALAHGALEAGHTVIGTVRKTADLAPFEALDAKAHGRILDVTDHAAVIDTVAEAEASIGPIDVLIANAGYGLEGVFEETPLSEVRAQFETNFFGAAATVQSVLPYMRKRRGGHIMAVTSMGGLMTVPGLSVYWPASMRSKACWRASARKLPGSGSTSPQSNPGRSGRIGRAGRWSAPNALSMTTTRCSSRSVRHGCAPTATSSVIRQRPRRPY
nr:SDR family NAD(P)-dependent oxidoreductase [Mycobacterium avium]